MLPRTMQIACLSFFMAVAAEGWASLSDNFKGINIYSLLPLLFIASTSGKPVSNITTVDLTNETITNFDLQSKNTTTISLNTNNETFASLKEEISALQQQVASLQMKTDNIEAREKETADLKARIARIETILPNYGTLNNRFFGVSGLFTVTFLGTWICFYAVGFIKHRSLKQRILLLEDRVTAQNL